MNIFVRPNGDAQCLYGENINLATIGALDIKRASHVEPDPVRAGKWLADLAPVGGPLLGPFDNRAAALAAEEKWLNDKMTETHVTAAERQSNFLEDRALRGPFDHL